jgi:hypothetical protein
LAIGAALVAYTTARAATLSLTHDEALTWLFHARAPLSQIFGFGGAIPTNNHLLNTLLCKAAATLLGPSELALRLPNLLAHAAYLFFSWKLLRRFVAPVTALAGFLLLNAQPFLLDFFSLCRGYGLSLGFLLAGLDSLAELDDEGETRGLLLIAVGCLASFSLIYAYSGVMLALLCVRRRLRWQSWAVTATLLAVVLPAVFKLRRELDFGGVRGFWPDTLGSLFLCLRYDVPASGWLFLAVAAALVPLLLPAGDAPRAPSRLFWALIPLGAALAEEATHHLFHMRFLTDRMATFYVPVVLLAALLALSRAPRMQRVLAWGAAALVFIHLLPALNLHGTYLWAYDADDKQMISELPRRPLRLGVTWVFSPSVEYYRLSRGLHWLAPVVRGSAFGDYDFVFVTPDDRAEAEARGLKLVKEYSPSGNCLFQRVRLGE